MSLRCTASTTWYAYRASHALSQSMFQFQEGGSSGSSLQLCDHSSSHRLSEQT